MCIVNMYLPLNYPIPPMFIFNLTGTQDNIMIDDSALNGNGLNFTNGLEINGDTVFLNLVNHTIQFLTIRVRWAVVKLYSITSVTKTVSIASGLYKEILPITVVAARVTAY